MKCSIIDIIWEKASCLLSTVVKYSTYLLKFASNLQVHVFHPQVFLDFLQLDAWNYTEKSCLVKSTERQSEYCNNAIHSTDWSV